VGRVQDEMKVGGSGMAEVRVGWGGGGARCRWGVVGGRCLKSAYEWRGAVGAVQRTAGRRGRTTRSVAKNKPFRPCESVLLARDATRNLKNSRDCLDLSLERFFATSPPGTVEPWTVWRRAGSALSSSVSGYFQYQPLFLRRLTPEDQRGGFSGRPSSLDRNLSPGPIRFAGIPPRPSGWGKTRTLSGHSCAV